MIGLWIRSAILWLPCSCLVGACRGLGRASHRNYQAGHRKDPDMLKNPASRGRCDARRSKASSTRTSITRKWPRRSGTSLGKPQRRPAPGVCGSGSSQLPGRPPTPDKIEKLRPAGENSITPARFSTAITPKCARDSEGQ